LSFEALFEDDVGLPVSMDGACVAIVFWKFVIGFKQPSKYICGTILASSACCQEAVTMGEGGACNQAGDIPRVER
jgi:hypothetical protein